MSWDTYQGALALLKWITRSTSGEMLERELLEAFRGAESDEELTVEDECPPGRSACLEAEVEDTMGSSICEEVSVVPTWPRWCRVLHGAFPTDVQLSTGQRETLLEIRE